MKAVIPVAGKGTRLAELTRRYAKPMLKFNSKPLLEHTLRSLLEAGIRDVVLVLGYKGEEIVQYFSDGSSMGLKIAYVEDSRLAGTATAIKAAEKFVSSTFLMVYGDVFAEPRFLESIISYHSEKCKERLKVAATLAVVKVDDPHNHAAILFADGKVKEIWSKKTPWVDMGIMVLEPEVFDAISQTPLSRGEYRILKSLSMMLDQGYETFAYPSSYPWIQIGDHEGAKSLIKANRYFLSKFGLKNYIEGSRIHESKLVNSSIISSRIIGSELDNCIVYENSRIISSNLSYCVVGEGVDLEGKTVSNEIITSETEGL